MNILPRAARCAALLLLFIPGTVPGFASDRVGRIDATVTLDVPYLPQTEALCGGAAAAMVFRFWGEQHASVQQFAPLVDRRAGGIADSTLIAAIRDRDWIASQLRGSLDVLRSELGAGRPAIILIEDRPQRYHYVVVVGMSDGHVVVHDPTWGPARQLTFDWLIARWTPTGFWTLRVTPAAGAREKVPASNAPNTSPVRGTNPTPTACDVQLDTALDDIQRTGIAHADDVLRRVMERCPTDARPWSELAGVRFAQRRWNEAGDLAREALQRDQGNSYAADVLASSRFMLDDVDGALSAWNLAGRPRLDSIQITGLTRTRYALLAEALGLETDQLLHADAFRLARRRLESMPDVASSRLSIRPMDDGFAVVDAAVAERASLPTTPVQAGAVGAKAVINREVTLRVPGRTGQGETWTGSWRWWQNRPAAALEFAAPIVGGPGGVWHVGLSWDAQTYAQDPQAPSREERLRGTIEASSWLAPDTRVSVTSSVDNWQRSGGSSARTVGIGGEVEQRFASDRVAARLGATHWFGMGGATGFTAADPSLSFRNTRSAAPFVLMASAGASLATEHAPLALWGGAGEGHAREALLRAHPLLDDGRVEGPVFGRRVVYATVESQHWMRRPSIVRVGVAGFVDAATASSRQPLAQGEPSQVDAGAGLRLRVPGMNGQLRADYARGLRDGAQAWSIGWSAE